MHRTRIAIFVGIAALLALVLATPSLLGILTDWWWFREIGFQVVFTQQLATQGWLFLAVAGVTAAVLYGNLRIAQRGVVPNPVIVQVGGPAAPQLDRTFAPNPARRSQMRYPVISGMSGM